ncbi:MAG: zinc-ribbon domain-containing protein [Pseudoxanthomonas sp.]
MAFCEKCGSTLSDSSAFCANCGARVSGRDESKEGADFSTLEFKSRGTEPKERKVSIGVGIAIFLLPTVFTLLLFRKGHSALSRVLGFGWLFVWIALLGKPPSPGCHRGDAVCEWEYLQSGSSQQSEVVQEPTGAEVSETRQPEKAPAAVSINVTAIELHAAYDANEIAADAKFKGKRLRVSGLVESIESDVMDEPDIVLYAGDSVFNPPRASGMSKAQAAMLVKGKSADIECTGAGEVMGTPMLEDCRLLSTRAMQPADVLTGGAGDLQKIPFLMIEQDRSSAKPEESRSEESKSDAEIVDEYLGD